MSSKITRFAPSPTGLLHLGHAASAARAFGFADANDGTCLLRIEDIDTTRCKPEYEQAIYDDLTWLGFRWPQPVRRQSDHLSDYDRVLQKLRQLGVVYRCFKTRKEILDDIGRAPHGSGNVYHGPSDAQDKDLESERVEQGKPFAWRLSLSACREKLVRFDKLSFIDNGSEIPAEPSRLGDVILARKDVGTSYHLACCHDDALQGITDIVRGVDLLESTHIHRVLQELMDWPVPRYHHHKLLTDENGQRFAKRDKSLTLRAMREQGISAKNVLARANGLG
jgi:glutamyl-Q tRNA(Asp) synthetase